MGILSDVGSGPAGAARRPSRSRSATRPSRRGRSPRRRPTRRLRSSSIVCSRSLRPVEVQREQIGSATKSQWRARFASARAEHEAAQAGLEAAQKKLGTVAEGSEAWQMAPPGVGIGGPLGSPVDYQLKQELRRQREDLTRSEKNLRELTIEADLAGVPADWRE